jgi:TonB family protein
MRKVLPRVMAFTLALLSPVAGQRANAPSDEPPPVVAAVAPAFPPVASASRSQGEVEVEVEVDAGGTVRSAKAVSGSQLLRKACETAAKKWRFAPLAGGTGSRAARLTFSFGYGDAKPPEPEFTVTFMPPYKVEVKHNPRIVN